MNLFILMRRKGGREREKNSTLNPNFRVYRAGHLFSKTFLSVLRRKRREHLTSPFLALSRGGGEKFETVFRD
jgi:hypothetical protein